MRLSGRPRTLEDAKMEKEIEETKMAFIFHVSGGGGAIAVASECGEEKEVFSLGWVTEQGQ